MREADLSIIILSYNTKVLLRRCLESLEEGCRGLARCEVIVVDNGSTDGSVEEVRNLKIKLQDKNFKLKIIENKENLGFSKGNNVGLREASGKYILFLNSDTEVFPGSLTEALMFMEKNNQIGALTPKTLLPSGRIDQDCHRGFPTPWASITYFLGLEKLFPKSKIFGQYHKFYLDLRENHEIDAGAGAFMMVPKRVIEKVGNWDESYFFYGEDLDFYYRIRQAGYKVMFYAKPLLLHHKGASSGLRKETKNIAKNSRENKIKVAKASVQAMEIFYKKFYREVYPVWLTFLVLIAIKIKGFLRTMRYYLG